MSRRVDPSDESGFSFPELTVGIAVGLVILFGAFAMIDASTRGSSRVTDRVVANQAARPAMLRILDRLHSGCVAPGTAPVLPGSSGDSISFVHQTGSGVNPTPTKKVIALSGGALTERTYPVTGGVAPDWTFSTTASSTQTILGKGVSHARLGEPPVEVPLFQYYEYVDGQIPGNSMSAPLDDVEASRAVQVTVSFAVSADPTSSVDDDYAASQLTDSAILRLTPPSNDTTEVNLPCE